MKTGRPISTVLAGAVLAVAAFAGAATSAQASTVEPSIQPMALSECGHNFCLWTNVDYNGTKAGWNTSQANVGDLYNDKASSLHNRTGRSIYVYQSADYVGAALQVFAYESVPRMSDYWITGGGDPISWNDKLTSFRL